MSLFTEGQFKYDNKDTINSEQDNKISKTSFLLVNHMTRVLFMTQAEHLPIHIADKEKP